MSTVGVEASGGERVEHAAVATMDAVERADCDCARPSLELVGPTRRRSRQDRSVDRHELVPEQRADRLLESPSARANSSSLVLREVDRRQERERVSRREDPLLVGIVDRERARPRYAVGRRQ